ncbi:UNVERIFIED_CONTAM: hypothetical protein HDU68_005363 [Siphonaria sp. JEL0065]|nr:hypothetical protein HDU68_005363 [Siphonaria sp. JEL0065]
MLSATINTRHSSPSDNEIDGWEDITTIQVEYQGSVRKIVLESEHEGGERLDSLTAQLKELFSIDPETAISMIYTTSTNEGIDQTAVHSDKDLRDVIGLDQPIPKFAILNLSHLESASNEKILSTRNLDIEYTRIEHGSGMDDGVVSEEVYKSKHATPYSLDSSISEMELDASFLVVVPPPSIPQQPEKENQDKLEQVDKKEETDDWIPGGFTKAILDGMGEAVDLFGGVVLLGVTVLFAWMFS